MIAVATGSRKLHAGEDWWPLLDELAKRYEIEEIWEGACTGADESVRVWAQARGLRVESFPAPWELYEQVGNKKGTAGPRRIDDMLEGRRGYVKGHSEHDPEAVDGVVAKSHVDGSPQMLIALPGHQGTRRTVRAARDRGLIIERLAKEPQVLNHYHFHGKGDGLPPRSRWIQRGQQPCARCRGQGPSPLANPFTKKRFPDIQANLGAYKRWLWDELKRCGPAMDELQSIEAADFLVCSCVRPDGSGGCHGHVIVKAWKWLSKQTDARQT